MNNEEFKLTGSLKKGTSQKGNEYTYLELHFGKDYSKRIFLDQAELVLLEKYISNNSSFPNLK